MKSLFKVAIAASLMFSGSAAPAAPQDTLAIVGADVLPMTKQERLRDQVVIVKGDRIVEVGPRAKVRIPTGARTIQAKGLILMPGLVDMHIHLAPDNGAPGSAAQRALAVTLGHGVTTARGMAGSPANLVVRDAIERGEIAGPRLYAAAPALNTNSVKSIEAARAAVKKAKEAGYDLIKSHHLDDPAIWAAVQDEAKKQGLATAGHVANEIGLFEAVAAGQQVEHLDGAFLELLPPGSPERNIPFAQIPPPPVMEAAARASDAQLREMASKVAAGRGFQVPTLALFEKVTSVSTPAEQLVRDPAMRYVPDAALKQWAEQHEGMKQAGFTEEAGNAFRDVRRRIVRAFRDAGVPIMAGSDTPQSFHLWGSGLIQEVEALGAAGLTPLEALRTATVVPRDYFRSLPNGGSSLGWKADFGTVEKGARADLILLNQDPSKNLSALRSLQTVIAGGKVYDRAALDAMLDKASADAKAVKPPTANTAAAAPMQVYVMRHFATAAGDDPALNSTGAAQAGQLAGLLEGAAIKAIFVTDTRRARESVAPLAAKLGLTASLYDPQNPGALTQAVAATGGNVLVVGHSNTVPDLVSRFGGTPPAPLGAHDFGTLWRVDSGSKVTKIFPVAGRAPAMLGACTGYNLHPSARCGLIKVAENRKQPGGRMIDIHFAVVPASATAVDAPVVVLPGGPGLGGAQGGTQIEQMFGNASKNRDILLIDQRGTGKSNGLVCPTPPQGEDPLAQLRSVTAEETKACRDALMKKADLSLYHTREAVLDMEEVRAALGYPQLDLFGMSYGTRPALDYLRLFPDRVGQTVIRAAAPAAMTMPLWGPRDTQTSFNNLVKACKEQPDCAARHPDMAANLNTILSRLKKAPMPVTFTDPMSGKKVSGDLTADGLGAMMFFLLYIPEYYVQLPPLLEMAAAGNAGPMVEATAPFLLGVGDQIAWGMYRSVICDEDVRRINPKQIAAATKGTFMGAQTVQADIDACAVWPKSAIPADYLKPLSSDKEVFIISGEFDPVAGKPWGDQIERTLPNSVHVEVKGASHLPPLPGCTTDLTEKFLDGAPLKSIDMSCVREAKRPKLRVAA